MLDFSNTEIAFSHKSDADLRNADCLFRAIKQPFIVKCGKGLAQLALGINFPVAWAVKPTLFKQFVGGETLKDCTRSMEQLQKFNVKSILDYSAEGGQSEQDIRYSYEETLRSIDFARNNPTIAYTVFKPSAMVTDELLAKASEKPETLTAAEAKEFARFRKRFMSLCERAYKNDVRILVDAEDYCFQDAIDRLTEEAMRLFNSKRAIVFATLQMYRHDRMPYLQKIWDDSRKYNYIAGIKFVRGAYMETERARASEMGYPDPICKDKQATDDNYNAGLAFVVDHIDCMELFSGTHNEYSNLYLAELMAKKGIQPNDTRIFFAQLYGMSDNISFNLANAGYCVAKYVPYAPVKKVLPYLIRRAEENTSMAGQTGRELRMIERELDRRKQKRSAVANPS